MKILVTGRPGSGKTTVVYKIAAELRNRGVQVGGMITYEAREKCVRTGFVVEDLKTGEKGLMASVNYSYGIRVGKYGVDINVIERIGVKAVEDAVSRDEVVIIDEIGPMELYSNGFKTAVSRAFSSSKKVVATIHYKASQDEFSRRIMRVEGLVTYMVDFDNRNSLPSLILSRLL